MYRKDVASSDLPSWVKDISRLEWLIRQEPFLFPPKEDVAFKNYMEEDFGSLGIVCYIAGFLECALLGEGGNKLFHGNFIWPMMFGMLILWISAFLHFFSIAKNPDTGKKRALIILGWILILIHLHYGFLYYKDILGQTFFM